MLVEEVFGHLHKGTIFVVAQVFVFVVKQGTLSIQRIPP